MIHLADDDVGDTSFAVMSDLGENGTEHECDLGVHETALRASAVIDALLAELEASKTNAEYYKSAFEETARPCGHARKAAGYAGAVACKTPMELRRQHNKRRSLFL